MTNSDLSSLYQDLLLDHSRERHGYGLHEDAAAESTQLNRSCGDEITLRVHGNSSVVDTISWTGQGCAISQASASMLSDIVQGLVADDVRARIGAFRAMVQSQGTDEGSPELLGDAVALSGVSRYVPRVKCAMLAWVALEDALSRVPEGTTAPASPDVVSPDRED